MVEWLFVIRRSRDAFHSTKISCLNLGTFPVAKGKVFARISGSARRDRDFVRHTQVFENFILGFSDPFNLLPEFLLRNFWLSWLSGSHFGNSTIYAFIQKFSREISVSLASLSKVPQYLVKWKAPPGSSPPPRHLICFPLSRVQLVDHSSLFLVLAGVFKRVAYVSCV